MTNNIKMKDKRIWARMGWELMALECMISKVLCDRDYNDLMDKKTWGKFYRAINAINDIRAGADLRSLRQGLLFAPEPFYGSGPAPARKMVDEFRANLIQEANAQAEQLYGKERKECDK